MAIVSCVMMVEFSLTVNKKVIGGLLFSPCKLFNLIIYYLREWCHYVFETYMYILYFQTDKLNADEEKRSSSKFFYNFNMLSSNPIISNVAFGKQHILIIYCTYGFIMFTTVYKLTKKQRFLLIRAVSHSWSFIVYVYLLDKISVIFMHFYKSGLLHFYWGTTVIFSFIIFFLNCFNDLEEIWVDPGRSLNSYFPDLVSFPILELICQGTR